MTVNANTLAYYNTELIFIGKTGAYSTGSPSKGRLLALPANIRLG